MQTFTGIEYIMIDVANQFGLDRLTWADRKWWVRNNRPDLTKLDEQAKVPRLFRKAVRALGQAERGEPTNHIMGLDATASGIQIMSAMSGCRSGAETVNLINTGKREDVYQRMATMMTELMGIEVTRDVVKKPVMTFFYGSQAVPRATFGEEGLAAFFGALKQAMPGPYELMQLFQSFWDPHATHYEWAMPDGHVAHVPVSSKEDKGLEIDEADHLRFTYRAEVVQAQPHGRALAANIVHSVDAWICRQMIKRAKKANFYLAPIHDCFCAHPNHMNQVRQMYVDLMAEVAQMNLVEMILSQIANQRVPYVKMTNNLHEDILQSEYALS